jgi:hypothetical protein
MLLVSRWQDLEQIAEFCYSQRESRNAADAPELECDALLGGGSLGIDQHREPGRSHEVDFAEVDDQTFGSGGKGFAEVALERGRGEHVHLTGYVGHHDRVAGLWHGDATQRGAAIWVGNSIPGRKLLAC